MAQCYTVAMLQWHNVAMLQWYNVAMVECYNFTNMLISRVIEKAEDLALSTIKSGEKTAYDGRQRQGMWRAPEERHRGPAGWPGGFLGRKNVKQARNPLKRNGFC